MSSRFAHFYRWLIDNRLASDEIDYAIGRYSIRLNVSGKLDADPALRKRLKRIFNFQIPRPGASYLAAKLEIPVEADQTQRCADCNDFPRSQELICHCGFNSHPHLIILAEWYGTVECTKIGERVEHRDLTPTDVSFKKKEIERLLREVETGIVEIKTPIWSCK